MGMSNHHTAQEENKICVPEMNLFFSKMCKLTPNKSQDADWN